MCIKSAAVTTIDSIICTKWCMYLVITQNMDTSKSILYMWSPCTNLNPLSAAAQAAKSYPSGVRLPAPIPNIFEDSLAQEELGGKKGWPDIDDLKLEISSHMAVPPLLVDCSSLELQSTTCTDIHCSARNQLMDNHVLTNSVQHCRVAASASFSD